MLDSQPAHLAGICTEQTDISEKHLCLHISSTFLNVFLTYHKDNCPKWKKLCGINHICYLCCEVGKNVAQTLSFFWQGSSEHKNSWKAILWHSIEKLLDPVTVCICMGWKKPHRNSCKIQVCQVICPGACSVSLCLWLESKLWCWEASSSKSMSLCKMFWLQLNVFFSL